MRVLFLLFIKSMKTEYTAAAADPTTNEKKARSTLVTIANDAIRIPSPSEKTAGPSFEIVTAHIPKRIGNSMFAASIFGSLSEKYIAIDIAADPVAHTARGNT